MKKLFLLFITLAVCDYSSAQYIIAGDTSAPDILYKSINRTIHVDGPPGGITYINESSYMYDVNNQGYYDFVFVVNATGAHGGGSSSACSVQSLDDNQVCVNSLPFMNNDTSYIQPLNAGDTIGVDCHWYTCTNKATLAWTFSNPASSQYGFGGIWDSLPYSYLGIRVKIGTLYYYGWIQMMARASSGADIDLKNSTIFKSHTGISDKEKGEKYSIYPNPANEKITIEQASPFTGGILTLYNNNAQSLITKEVNGAKTELDLGSYGTGMYYLVVKSQYGTQVKKIIKE
jgi:hypothetical protein